MLRRKWRQRRADEWDRNQSLRGKAERLGELTAAEFRILMQMTHQLGFQIFDQGSDSLDEQYQHKAEKRFINHVSPVLEKEDLEFFSIILIPIQMLKIENNNL